MRALLTYVKVNAFTLLMLMLGAVLIMGVGFGFGLSWAPTNWVIQLVCKGFGVDAAAGYKLEMWEVAAVSWLLVYCFLFFLLEFPDPKSAKKRAHWFSFSRLGNVPVVGTVVLACVVVVLYRWDMWSAAVSHAAAAGLIPAWLVFTDVVLRRRREVRAPDKKKLGAALRGIDLPSVCAFVVLVLFALFATDDAGLRGRVCDGQIANFVAGAAALNLTFVSVGFAMIWLERWPRT